MEDKFIEPTVASRVKIALCVIFIIATYPAEELWGRSFMAFIEGLPICESLTWLRGIVIAHVLLFWLVGLLASSLAIQTLRSGEFPLPGAWVWFRTKVRTGWKAKVDGYILVIVALFFFLGPVVAWYFLPLDTIFFCWSS